MKTLTEKVALEESMYDCDTDDLADCLEARYCDCGGELILMGTLGNLDHFNCRGCGLHYHAEAEAA